MSTYKNLIDFLTICDMIMSFHVPNDWFESIHYTVFGFAAEKLRKWFEEMKWLENLKEKQLSWILPNPYALPKRWIVGCCTFFVCITIMGSSFGSCLIGVSRENGSFWRTRVVECVIRNFWWWLECRWTRSFALDCGWFRVFPRNDLVWSAWAV